MHASIALLLIVAACKTSGADTSTPPQPTGDIGQPDPGAPPDPAPTDPAPPEPTTPAPEGQCSGPPPSPSHTCVQDCGPPVAQAGDPPPGWSWLSAEQANNRKQFGCPICLPSDARIATPSGEVAISSLAPGAVVWTLDGNGRRVPARVAAVLSTPVPPGHRLTVIELDDGRRLRASPGHPDASGRAVGRLRRSARLDGAGVLRTRRVPYVGHTYDLVLEGGRHYWSDGVLVQSSVTKR